MVEQLTLNQLVRGSSPRPATSGKPFRSLPTPILQAPVAFGHIGGVTGPAVAVEAPRSTQPVEHLDGQVLPALGTATRLLGPLVGPAGRTAPRGGHQTRPAERMDGRGAFEPMELTHRQGLLAATTLLLGTFIHGTSSKTPRSWRATARPWGVSLGRYPYSTVTDLARFLG